MTKIKPLLPSLREKKRYLVFGVKQNNKYIDFDALNKAILKSVVRFIGVKGTAESGFWMMKDKWMPKINKGIIKINHKYINEIKTALMLINSINVSEKNTNKIKAIKIKIEVLNTCGSLKKATFSIHN